MAQGPSSEFPLCFLRNASQVPSLAWPPASLSSDLRASARDPGAELTPPSFLRTCILPPHLHPDSCAEILPCSAHGPLAFHRGRA